MQDRPIEEAPVLSTVLSVLLTTVHAIADFAGSSRVGWVGIAVTPLGVVAIVWPLTRKYPTNTNTHEGDR